MAASLTPSKSNEINDLVATLAGRTSQHTGEGRALKGPERAAVLNKIAKETGKGWAQVLIRWSLQRG